MTNQEAIDKMEFCKRAYQMLIDEKSQEGILVGKGYEGEWKSDTPIDEAYKDMRDACDMAIKALEQEPSGDLISRQEVLNAIMANNIRENEYNLTSSRIKKAVENLPPVNPQPKTGHWKRNETIRLTYCSECGFGQHIDEFRTYNYCPNCGARMVDSDIDGIASDKLTTDDNEPDGVGQFFCP